MSHPPTAHSLRPVSPVPTPRIVPAGEWAEGLGDAAGSCRTVVCVEIEDRSISRAALQPSRTQAIWERIARDFGASYGVGLLGDYRCLFTGTDTSQWLSVTAAVFEAAAACGMEGSDLAVGIGTARFDEPSHLVSDVVRLAVNGAHAALERGIGVVEVSAASETRAERDAQLESSLRAALSGHLDGMRIILQPKVDAWTRQTNGAEALLRFRCPSLGDVSVVEFLAMAARCNELQRVDRWVLSLAAEHLALCARRGLKPVPISVNIRAETALEPSFPEFVQSLTSNFQLPSSLLSIELREAEAIKHLRALEGPIAALRHLGFHVILDDFGACGTEIADLSCLQVSTLKLNRGLVRDVIVDPSARKSATALIRIGNALGLGTAAVGIETEGQAELLRGAGCRVLQGFLFHRPLEVDDFVSTTYGWARPSLQEAA